MYGKLVTLVVAGCALAAASDPLDGIEQLLTQASEAVLSYGYSEFTLRGSEFDFPPLHLRLDNTTVGNFSRFGLHRSASSVTQSQGAEGLTVHSFDLEIGMDDLWLESGFAADLLLFSPSAEVALRNRGLSLRVKGHVDVGEDCVAELDEGCIATLGKMEVALNNGGQVLKLLGPAASYILNHFVLENFLQPLNEDIIQPAFQKIASSELFKDGLCTIFLFS